MAAAISDVYLESLRKQRQERADSLLADRGWLTLAGLCWLHEGANTLGADAANDVRLPASVPDHAGILRWEDDKVTLYAAPGVEMRCNGVPVTVLEMKSNWTAAPDFVEMGDLTFTLLQWERRFALRVWDRHYPARRAFTGLRWYEINPAYCIVVRFVAYDPPKPMRIADAVGEVSEVASPGYVSFFWQGSEYRLDAQARGKRLFYNFRDATNGDTTYGAGRFLYSPLPENGQVTIDFNQATNPFCAYTPYAVCPLPPEQNRLPFRVEAGEMRYLGPV